MSKYSSHIGVRLFDTEGQVATVVGTWELNKVYQKIISECCELVKLRRVDRRDPVSRDAV